MAGRVRKRAGDRGSPSARGKMRWLNSIILTGFGKFVTGGLPHPGCQDLAVRSGTLPPLTAACAGSPSFDPAPCVPPGECLR